MPELAQHIIALTIVLACVGYAGWQAFQAVRGRRSRVGGCCAKGCSTSASTSPDSQTKPPADRIIYVPVDMLRRGRRN